MNPSHGHRTGLGVASSRMSNLATFSIAPSQRWEALADPAGVITIQRAQDHRWIVRSTDGLDRELTGAAIRAQYRFALDR